MQKVLSLAIVFAILAWTISLAAHAEDDPVIIGTNFVVAGGIGPSGGPLELQMDEGQNVLANIIKISPEALEQIRNSCKPNHQK